ncbi:MAG: apolipoprotein N-acyltransferase [Candidatus Omnitrophica bacterium]|nr:apolipoprotein N-acyltransferase [Candidatus Omnitrophota bacterium]
MISFLKFFKSRSGLLAGISSILLILAFPKTDFWALAWVGLIPFLFSIDGKSLKDSFRIGYFCGFIFFGFTFYWLCYVTFLGAVILSCYFAIFFGLFGLATSFFQKQKSFWKLFLIPAAWVVLEFARAHLISGMSWASLGLSQYKNLPAIQISDITGMYGVSFLIVLINIGIKESLFSREKISQRWTAIVTVVVCLGLALGYGQYRLKCRITPTGNIKIAIIQPSVGLTERWRVAAWDHIIQNQISLSRQSLTSHPELIIWPESAVPGVLPEEEELFTQVKGFASEEKIPLLLGAVVSEDERIYYNSALLLSQEGQTVKRYDKLKLVPYGEYIPYRRIFPFLKYVVPIDDFTPGKEFTVFDLKGARRFSVLICFEDSSPGLSRAFVNNGAQVLINITNDDWFKDTQAPFLHLEESVFRAVENRKMVVRAANTGVSCFINPLGKVVKAVTDKNGKMTYVQGFAAQSVSLNSLKTFYTKFGDLFAWLCVGYVILGMISTRKRPN